MEADQLSHEESLKLINSMISKAKESYHDTGVGAMLWGAVIVICSLVKLTEIHFGYNLPFDIYFLALVAIIPQLLISRRENKMRRVKTYDDIFMKYIWMGFGIAIFLLIHVNSAVFNSWQPVAREYRELSGHLSPFRFSEFVPSLFLILYGLPTFITGASCKFKPMLYGGIFCWICSIITVYTPIKTDLLLTAFSALMAWFIPGLIMEKNYRQAKMMEKKNV